MSVAATTVYTSSGALTATGDSGDLTVSSYSELSLDCNISAVSGSSPTLQLFVDRKGADNTYYPIWQSASIGATTKVSTSIGAGLAYNQGFGSTIKLRWVIGGSSPSFTASFSIIGK